MSINFDPCPIITEEKLKKYLNNNRDEFAINAMQGAIKISKEAKKFSIAPLRLAALAFQIPWLSVNIPDFLISQLLLGMAWVQNNL